MLLTHRRGDGRYPGQLVLIQIHQTRLSALPPPPSAKSLVVLLLNTFAPVHEAQYQRLGAEQDWLPREPTRTSSGNCQETETRMVRACHARDSLSETILQDSLGMDDAVVDRENTG